MTILQALLLGIFQGISEFLPISSSGHLLVLKELLGLSDVPRLFDVVLHLATLLSVLVVFRKRIAGILGALYRWIAAGFKRPDNTDSDTENLALILPALVATIATAAIGLVLDRYAPIESPRVVSALFLLTAVALIISSRFKGTRGYSQLSILGGLGIGIAQGIGVFPGISRSGITIAGGLAVGLNRETAGEFAFLLAVPAILGAFLLDLKDAVKLGSSVGALPLTVGFTAAFAVGIVALSILMPIVRKGKLSWFAVYLIPVGVLGLFLFR